MKLKNLNSKLASLLLSIAVIIGTFSMSSCKKESTYTIGQKHDGGIIISLDETGKHGLIMTEEDINELSVSWKNAQEQCESYNLEEGNWRLPTKEELLTIHQNREMFNLSEEEHIGGGFFTSPTYYWSSTISNGKS